MKDVLVIAGSARRNGGAAASVRHLSEGLGDRLAGITDLSETPMAHFSYDCAPEDDGFMRNVELMLEARSLVFVTPVYWYAMSGVMKVFFDRLTDLILTKPRRPTGRALAGRDVWLLACGTDEALPPGFDVPFRLTSDYFGWHWREACYIRSAGAEIPDEKELEHAKAFGERIAQNQA